MTKKVFIEKFWQDFFWGHIDAYHNNASLEELKARFSNSNIFYSSTFITNDDEYDGDLGDFILDELLKNFERIENFLEYSEKPNLVIKVRLPKNIGSLRVSLTGEIDHPTTAFIVVNKYCGMISSITAYPKQF